MTHARLLAFLFAFALPVVALGADTPELSVSFDRNRTLFASYSDMPGGTYEVRIGSKVVKEDRIEKGTSRKRVTLPRDLASGNYALVFLDKNKAEVARHAFTVSYEAPTCKATLSKKSAEKGDFVTLRWRSENADKAYVFGKSYPVSGTERIALYHPGTRVFAVNMVGKGGIGSCRAQVIVK